MLGASSQRKLRHQPQVPPTVTLHTSSMDERVFPLGKTLGTLLSGLGHYSW